MKCQSCGKKEAVVSYKEDINGKKQELYFCSDCAKNLGFIEFSSIFSPLFISIPEYKKGSESFCKECGTSLEEYSHSGMFGCPSCYDTFSDKLDELFLKIHGKNRHEIESKNSISNVDKKGEVLKLRSQLKKLIQSEEYEEAAKIRDAIKKIEGK